MPVHSNVPFDCITIIPPHAGPCQMPCSFCSSAASSLPERSAGGSAGKPPLVFANDKAASTSSDRVNEIFIRGPLEQIQPAWLDRDIESRNGSNSVSESSL